MENCPQNATLPNVIPNPTSNAPQPQQDSIIADLLTLDLSGPVSGKYILFCFFNLFRRSSTFYFSKHNNKSN